MPVNVSVGGHDGFDKVAAKLKAAEAQWDRELDRGARAAGEVVAKEIRESSDPYMPKGYEKVFAASMVTTVSVRARGSVRRAIVAVKAFGRKGHDRQVEQLEKGRLKHKFWGQWVNVPQAWQKIRAGFASEPAQRAAPEAAKEVDKAVRRVTDKIGK